MRQFIPFAILSGIAPAVKTQTKSATITANGESVTVEPDSGYLLSSVTATANIPTEEKSQAITSNGTYTITPSSGKLMTKASVSVNVPTGGGLEEGQVAVYWPYTNGKILVSEPVDNANTAKEASMSFTLNGEVSGCGVFMLSSNVTGGTSTWCGGYGIINTNSDSAVQTKFNALRNDYYGFTNGAATPTFSTSGGITTVTIKAGRDYSWAKGAYRMIYVCANNGGIL